MSIDGSSSQPTRPAQLDPRDFPSYQAYQTARARALTRARVRNIRLTSPYLSLAEIAYRIGLPAQEIKAALDPDLTISPETPS